MLKTLAGTGHRFVARFAISRGVSPRSVTSAVGDDGVHSRPDAAGDRVADSAAADRAQEVNTVLYSALCLGLFVGLSVAHVTAQVSQSPETEAGEPTGAADKEAEPTGGADKEAEPTPAIAGTGAGTDDTSSTKASAIEDAQDAAQDTAPEATEAYRKRVEQAVQEFQLGNYAEARALFGQAHRLYPNARTARGLGLTEFELKNYPQSISYLEQALASEVRPLSGRLREDTQGLVTRAKGFVGQFTLVLEPEPTGKVRIWVDGARVRLDAAGQLFLSVGQRRLQIRARGYHEILRTVNVLGGEQERIEAELRPLTPEPETPKVPPPSLAVAPSPPVGSEAPAAATAGEPLEDAGGSVWSSPWLWAGAGAVVVGGVVAVLALSSGGDSSSSPTIDADLTVSGL